MYVGVANGPTIAALLPRYVGLRNKKVDVEETYEVQSLESEKGKSVKASDAKRTIMEEDEGSLTGIALWVGASALFGAGVDYFMGNDKASEYFAGYILEQSLSVDNLLVFVLVFEYFKVIYFGRVT